MRFLKTTENQKHYHLVYQKQVGGGVTSVDDGHYHDLIESENKSLSLSKPLAILATAKMTKSHSHELLPADEIPTPPVEENTGKDEKNIIKEVLNLRDASLKRESKARTMAREAINICDKNQQWTSAQIEKCEKDSLAWITVNEIKNKIELFEGYQRRNRTDTKARPIEGGDGVAADVMSFLIKFNLEGCNYFLEETQIFHDFSVTGRGFWNCYVDYDSDPTGTPVIERFPCLDAVLGPHNKMDARDMEYFIKERAYSVDKICETYPAKSAELRKFFSKLDGKDDGNIGTSGDIENPAYESEGGVREVYEDPEIFSAASKLYDKYKKTVSVIELNRKVFRRSRVLATSDPLDGDVINAENWSAKDIAKAKTIQGIAAIPRTIFRVKVTKVAGPVVLEEYYLDEIYHRIKDPGLFLTPCYAYRYCDDDEEFFMGKVEYAKSLQLSLNVDYSLMIDVSRKMVSRAKFYDEETFPNPDDEENYIQNANIPGAVFKIKNMANIPKSEEGYSFPSEVYQAILDKSAKIEKLMNINASLAGQSKPEQSGIAILREQNQALLGNESLFDNFHLSKRGAMINYVKLIQQTHTPDKVIRILKHENDNHMGKNKTPMSFGGKMLVADQEEAQAFGAEDWVTYEQIAEILNNMDLTKYDISLDEVQYNATIRLAHFAAMYELFRQRPDMPFEMIIEYWPDLPEDAKKKFREAIEAQRMAEAAAEERKQASEVKKTEIANIDKLSGQLVPGQDGGGGVPEGQRTMAQTRG